MSTLTVSFDTLRYVKRLKAANVPESQAEAQAEALRELWGAQEVATRSDVRELEAATDSKFDLLRKDIVNLEQRLAGRIELAEECAKSCFTLLYWMFGFMIAGLASLVLKAYF